MASHSDPTRLKLFISHQWTDKQKADRLARDLESFADVWMDYRNLRPGDQIQTTIDAALKETDVVLVVWTEHAQRSSGVLAEIEASLKLGVRVVPCIVSYDEHGNPLPPLTGSLQPLLGVDFHDYESGLAQVTALLLDLQTETLPRDVAQEPHPRTRMLNRLKGYLSYLENYRNLKGVADKRAEWVDNIIGEIELYVKGGGDRAAVEMLVGAARRSKVNDAEGIGMLVSRLEKLVGDVAPQRSSVAAVPQVPPPIPRQAFEWQRPSPPPPDELARRVAAVVPAGTAEQWLSQVDVYLSSAPVALQALTAQTASLGSQGAVQVVAYLHGYLDNANDAIPDHQGRFGLLDDAWLILNTTFRLIESGLMPAAAAPLDWRTIIAADHVVQAIIPPDALSTLSAAVFQMLQVIAAEVSSYQPWFTPQGQGYAPTLAAPASTGGFWEDEMKAGLRGTGFSVNW